MNVDGRVVNLTELFYNKAADLQAYLAEHDPAFARRFTTELFDFISDVVAPNPYAFVEYPQRPTPEKAYRRAVFKRTYIVVYKVTDTDLDILTVYHTSQNPDKISLGE